MEYKRILGIKEIHRKSIEYFGKDFLNIKDKSNNLCQSWEKIDDLYKENLKTGLNNRIDCKNELTTLINFIEIFKSLKTVNHNLKLEFNSFIRDNFYKNIIKELKSISTYQAYWNLISLPAFLEGRSIELFPIIEAKGINKKTPDYLAKYKNKCEILIECKTTDFNLQESNLKNNVEKRVKDAKSQLEIYPNHPGLCFIKTNNLDLFNSFHKLISFVEKKINRDTENTSCIVFTYYNDETFPRYSLKYLPFINYRSKVLLPKGFLKDIFGNAGTILLSAKKNERFYCTDIKEICKHYEVEPIIIDENNKFELKKE